MNAKILLMTALVGGASVLAFAGCSSDDDKTSDDAKDDKDASSSDNDSGGDTNTDDKDSGGGNTVDCSGSACEKACEKAAAANCGDGDAISSVCKNAVTYRAALPDCADEIDTAVACYNDKATYTCENGNTTPSGCEAEFEAVGTCVQAALSGDAGSDAGN